MRRALRLAAALALLAPAPAGASPYDDLLREHLWVQTRALPAGERPRVGLVLSAGSVRGLAHVGVLQVLEDAGFPVDVVAGTSMGAVVGALYSAGVDMARLRTLPKHLSLSSGNNLSAVRLIALLLRDSLLSTEKFEDVLADWIGEMRFDQTLKPFACVAMDLRTGERVVFRHGPLALAVRASMNLPGIFKPVAYRHRYLVDGGVVDYIPVSAAKLLGAEWILASVTEGDFTRTRPSNVFLTLQQIFDIRGSILSRRQREEADVVIEPALGDVDILDVERAQEAMEKGMLAARAKLEPAQEAYILATLPRLIMKWRTGK